jgi:hypothetical protein
MLGTFLHNHFGLSGVEVSAVEDQMTVTFLCLQVCDVRRSTGVALSSELGPMSYSVTGIRYTL